VVDKGVRTRIGVRAVDKGVTWTFIIDSRKFEIAAAHQGATQIVIKTKKFAAEQFVSA
jgi:hypothetical protein